jgi:hypothetical protein
MRYLLAVLPALTTISAVSAQSVVGVYSIPASEAAVPNASSSTSVASVSADSAPTATSTSVDLSSMPTAAPFSSQDSSYGYTDMMPYSSLTQGGYQQMGCGYGYARQSPQGYCMQQPWVSLIVLNMLL